ncbi:MAG TPA: hypothetical protein VGF92_07360 [Stellaceae bacterium]
MAERHVSQGNGHIEHQRALIARLERGGHNTGEAKRLLNTFLALEATHIADRDRLRKALAKAGR